MRTILFRAKTVNGNDWVESMTIANGTIKRKAHDIFMEISENKWVGVKKETLGQFTGLIDKKNKRIFEGDIVDIIHPCWSAKCETCFIDGAFFFCEKNNPENNSWVRSDKFLKQQWEIKIIGNIHDNPELLQ